MQFLALFLLAAAVTPTAFASGSARYGNYATFCWLDGDNESGNNVSEQGMADGTAYVIKRNADDGYPVVVSTDATTLPSGRPSGYVVTHCVTSKKD